MKNLKFFLTKTDITRVVENIKVKRNLKFSLMTSSPESRVVSLNGAELLPHLGRASGEQTSLSNSYLVTDQLTVVKSRRIDQYDGNTRFEVDQLVNRESVVLTPAGEWSETTLIAGQLGSASNSPLSLSLFRLIGAEIKRHSSYFTPFWVGEEAQRRWYGGSRLTEAVQSPPEYDLQPSAFTIERSRQEK